MSDIFGAGAARLLGRAPLWALLVAPFVVGIAIGVALSASPPYYQICEVAEAGQKQCTAYSIAPFFLIKVMETLDAYSVLITALATIAIAYFTYVLHSVTGKAADAAKKSADALPNVERAYLFLRDTRDFRGGPFPENPGETKSCVVQPIFDNLGKTPAILKSYRCGIVANGKVPTTNDLLGLTEQRLKERAIASGGYFSPTVKVEIRGDWKPRPFTLPYADRVFLVGTLQYDDVFRGRQETCFCWELDWAGNTLKEALDVPSLNYHRSLSPDTAY
jgi:hypothetical protein